MLMVLILARQHDEAYGLGVREGVLKIRVIVTSDCNVMDWEVRDWQRDMGERRRAWGGFILMALGQPEGVPSFL